MSVGPIILAEDNDKLRRLYSDRLTSEGFTVVTADDGEKAVALLHKIAKPQIIILDVMMPRMDGIEACRLIRKMQGQHPSPLIFLTALDTPQTMLECLVAGGDDFLMKSASLEEMVQRVYYWIRRGPSDATGEQRAKAIRELTAIVERPQMDAAEQGLADNNSLAIGEIAAFIERHRSALGGEAGTLFRFGYMVGLFQTHAPAAVSCQMDLDRSLRILAFRTAFVEPREIESLISNYRRIVLQGQFRRGLERGSGDAGGVLAGMQTLEALPGETVPVS